MQHACLLFNQRTPVALHLIFNILLDCSPPTNLAVSLTTLSDWNVLSGEADKLISRKHFSNYKYDFHLWSDDSPTQVACLLSNQKTPVALHLTFNILLDCSPPTNLAVSLTTLSDWNVLSGEADKLISRKHFSNYKYDFHLRSDDSPTQVAKRGKWGHLHLVPTESKPRAYVIAKSLTASGSGSTSLIQITML